MPHAAYLSKACQMCIFVTDMPAITHVLYNYCSHYIVAAVRILEQQLTDALQYDVSTRVNLCSDVAHK
jgi:hypothetical protein